MKVLTTAPVRTSSRRMQRSYPAVTTCVCRRQPSSLERKKDDKYVAVPPNTPTSLILRSDGSRCCRGRRTADRSSGATCRVRCACPTADRIEARRRHMPRLRHASTAATQRHGRCTYPNGAIARRRCDHVAVAIWRQVPHARRVAAQRRHALCAINVPHAYRVVAEAFRPHRFDLQSSASDLRKCALPPRVHRTDLEPDTRRLPWSPKNSTHLTLPRWPSMTWCCSLGITNGE